MLDTGVNQSRASFAPHELHFASLGARLARDGVRAG